jgi:hypothetical protein
MANQGGGVNEWQSGLKRSDALSGLTLLCLALFAWVGASDLPIGTLHRPGGDFSPSTWPS